ncbi:MAG: hypothetical protein QM657_06085 [Lacrimispora sp.]|uniref:hypothetical protein n=1 Tax=Lacrimispora sp. TaxID=2719234 RepID=UPI0039E6E9BC
MNANWKQDPRLKKMNPQKISLLTEFAKRVESAPKDQLLPTLLSLNAEASKKGIQFNDEETDLLMSIMSANMNENEKKRMETLRLLSRNLSRRGNK